MQTLFNILQEKASRPTVLYLHGVAHTRGYPHRVDLYKVGHEGNTIRYRFMILMFWSKDLLDAGFPVLAIDYRWLQMATICNKSITFHPKGALVTLQRWLTSERRLLWRTLIELFDTWLTPSGHPRSLSGVTLRFWAGFCHILPYNGICTGGIFFPSLFHSVCNF